VLETARAIYRKSEIRELHVLDDSVTVRASLDGESAHAVVEWRNARPFWRSSLGPTKLAAAIALAGIYELEELLGEELSDCAATDPDGAGARGAGQETPPTEVDDAGTRVPEKAEDAPEPVRPARRLVLHFSALEDGSALCHPAWEDDVAPPGHDPALVAGADAPHPDENAALLRFAFRARKAGFVHDTEAGGWRLSAGPGAISRFMAYELPRWETAWPVSGTDELVPLARLLPFPELEVFAESVEGGMDSNSDAAPTEMDGGWGETGGRFGAFGDSRQGVRKNARGLFPGGHSAGSFRLRWRLRLGTEWIPDALARKLFEAPSGAPLYIPGHGTVRLSEAQTAAMRGWRESAAAEASGALPPYALLSLFSDGRLQVSADPALAAWRSAFLAEPRDPAGLPGFLRPYQAAGAAWMLRMHSLGIHPLLADEMGLGKTVQTLALIATELAADAGENVPGSPASGPGNAADSVSTPFAPAGEPAAPALVVCPASVVPVWEAEAARFFPDLKTRVLGRDGDWRTHCVPAPHSQAAPPVRPAPVLWLASYATLRLRRSSLAGVEFSIAVLDEAQFIKNPDAAVSTAVSAIRARRRLALTGTPLENHPRDIWAIFRFLMPGLLGTRDVFEAALETDPGAVARIARQVAPFILRRGKETVAPELPPKVTATLPCPMTRPQRVLYERIVREGLDALENAAGSGVPFGGGSGLFAYLTRLRQAACDPGLLPGHEGLPPTDSGKITLLAENLAPILQAGRKVVVFSQFVRLLDRVELVLREKFPGVSLHALTGATADRAAPVAKFQKTAGAAVMLASLRAGGAGVTLNAAEYVFLLDPWWNPAVEAQAADRVHRIGQHRPTFVYRMISEDTVESRVEALKAAKSTLFSQIVGAIPDMSEWRSQLPPLLELLR
jgi:hypothetical protein